MVWRIGCRGLWWVGWLSWMLAWALPCEVGAEKVLSFSWLCVAFVCFYCLIGLVGGASRGLSRKVMFLVTNYRIFLTRRTSCHAENHGWSRMSVMNFLFYHELSNFRINTFNHAENRGGHELSNYRIVSSHGESRKVTGSCHELSNYRIFFTRSVAEGHGFLSRIIETCPWTHWPTGGNYRIVSSHVR